MADMSDDMNDANGGPNTADPSDRWTVRGIGPDTRRKAADMAAKADIPLGRWLSQLIERAADKSDMTDIPADDLATVLARLGRLERAVFTADKADLADIVATSVACQTTADMSDAPKVADRADSADNKPNAMACPTRSPASDAKLVAAMSDTADTGTHTEAAGANDSMAVPGAVGAPSFGVRLAAAMSATGFGQRRVAELTGLSQSTVSYIVNGKRQPDADIIEKLGKVFPQLL